MAADGQQAVPLDDVMLAMDVVDTIRHREEWVTRELDEVGRRAELMSRLRTIYAGQGITVSDEVLAQGIEALNEDRFVYKPTAPGFQRTLALLWVERSKHAKRAAVALLAVAALFGAYYELAIKPVQQRRAALSEAHATAVSNATAAEARGRADRLLADGTAALEDGNTKASEEALSTLQALGDELTRDYSLRIVSTHWKQRPNALHERVYYLVVEAVAPDGGILERRVVPEDGSPRLARRWGIEVSRDVFVSVDQDLRDNGRIDDDQLGVKPKGTPDVQFRKPVLGNVITDLD